jgi:hypothetical protein
MSGDRSSNRAKPPQERDEEPGGRPRSQPRRGYQRMSVGEAVLKSFIRSVASSLGRIIARALTGRGR